MSALSSISGIDIVANYTGVFNMNSFDTHLLFSDNKILMADE